MNKKVKSRENQIVEWKETWRDEYLKWICGFANAQGGVLEIGKNNRGVVVGISNASKLLEELPNKIRSTMGILADVNLYTEKSLDYIVIKISLHPNAISFRGKYYFRSGQIEAWGRGIEKMKSGCIADNLPEPEFDILATMFSICFHIRNNNKREEALDGGVNGGVNYRLDELKAKIVALMIENPEITAEKIAGTIQITKRRVEYNVAQLKKSGVIERVGADKTGKWIVRYSMRGKSQ
ncbi:MAG: putative DNA binding domain-containing protein [Spirochaetes bacterium]|nr:putative DNA binding domain-containing protein [Spirochaetota bacterium]